MILLVMSAGIQAPPEIQDGLSPSFFRRLKKRERCLHSYNMNASWSTVQTSVDFSVPLSVITLTCSNLLDSVEVLHAGDAHAATAAP